jgi:hypothetical protein
MRPEHKALTTEMKTFFDWIFTQYIERGINYSDARGWREYSTNRLVDHIETFPMKGSCLIFTKTFGHLELLGYTNYGYWHKLSNFEGLYYPDVHKQAMSSTFAYLCSFLDLEELPLLNVDYVFGATEDKVHPFYIANSNYHFPLEPLGSDWTINA